MRRPHRSIETFDISLMAVVTKAMGAFLVMMLLLIPSYIAVPEMQTKLSDIETETRQLEQKAASVTEENRELEQENTQLAQQQRQSTTEQTPTQTQKIVVLQEGSSTLPSLPNRKGGYPALLIFFDWAGCAPKNIDFYLERANTPGWPEVQPGPQPLPPGVMEYPPERLGALVIELADPGPWSDMLRPDIARERFWIVNGVLPGTTYALYAKARGLEPGCEIGANVLLTAPHSVEFYSAVYNRPNSAVSHRPITEESRQIVVLARLHWDGESLTYEGVDERHLLTETLARARDQKGLDERLEKQGFHN